MRQLQPNATPHVRYWANVVAEKVIEAWLTVGIGENTPVPPVRADAQQ